MDIVDGLRAVAGAPSADFDCVTNHKPRMRNAADEIERLRAENEAKDRRIAELELALVKHGTHSPDCEAQLNIPCFCGLDDAVTGKAALSGRE